MNITVPTLTQDNTRRPNLPEDVGFSLVEDHGDTMTVQIADSDWDRVFWYVAPWADKVARVRWTHETGGTMWRGHKVRTDRESQGLILAAAMRGQPVRWKFADSWADMSAADLQSLADTVASHVEACFRREEQLQNDPSQNIHTGWPTGWTD